MEPVAHGTCALDHSVQLRSEGIVVEQIGVVRMLVLLFQDSLLVHVHLVQLSSQASREVTRGYECRVLTPHRPLDPLFKDLSSLLWYTGNRFKSLSDEALVDIGMSSNAWPGVSSLFVTRDVLDEANSVDELFPIVEILLCHEVDVDLLETHGLEDFFKASFWETGSL